MEQDSPVLFETAGEMHDWLQKNHGKARELMVRFYHAKSKKEALSYSEAVDEALCFGWIDRHPQELRSGELCDPFLTGKKNSIWSRVNIGRMKALIDAGRAHTSGLQAFNQRSEKRSGVYSFEQDKITLAPAYVKQFRANKKAWKFFCSQAPWYQRTSVHWVMSAKREETQIKRLATLIADSADGKPIAIRARKPKAS